MNYISSTRLHLISFSYNLRIFFCCILIEPFMLNLAQDYALEKGSDFIFREVIGKFTHLIQKVDVFIQN